MQPSRSYHDDLIRDLKDPGEASAYLNVALAEGDEDHFLVALRNVAEAHVADLGSSIGGRSTVKDIRPANAPQSGLTENNPHRKAV